MTSGRRFEELAAQASPCWRLLTASPGADTERVQTLQRAHYRDADDAIDAAHELADHVEGWDELLTFTAAVRAGLARQREPCWVVRCRDCGTPLGDDEDEAVAALHFADPTAAYEAAEHQGWVVEVRAGTRMVCPACQPPAIVPGGPAADRFAGEATGELTSTVDRTPGPGQLTLAGTDPESAAELDPASDPVTRSTAASGPRDDAKAVADTETDPVSDPELPAGADAAVATGDAVPAEFVISRELWEPLAVALARGDDPGPRPPVFSPDRVEALARIAPQTAMRAVRDAVGWRRAPRDLADLATCLQQWRVEPGDGHFVKVEHAAAARGRTRVAVATCGDCGYPVTRRGGATARWVPIWPHPGPPTTPGPDQPGAQL